MGKEKIIGFLQSHQYHLTYEEYGKLLLMTSCVRQITSLGDDKYCFTFDDYSDVIFMVG